MASRLAGALAGANPAAKVRAAFPLLLVFVSCLALMILVLFATAQSMGTRRFLLAVDFRAYYTAGRMVLGGVGSDFYDIAIQRQWQRAFAPEVSDPSRLMPFVNPPFAAGFLAPIAALPLETAYLVWALFNVALLSLTCHLLVDALRSAGLRTKFVALATVLTFLPVWMTVIQGQLSFVLVLALLLGWRSLRSGRDLQGGLWLSVLMVKPQLLLVPALALAWQRRVLALSGLALGAAALLAASLLLVGWQGLEGYVRLLVAASSWGDAYTMHPQAMHTWRGFLHLLLGTDDGAQVQVWWLLGIALALGVLLWAWRGPWSTSSSRFDLQWALLVLATLFTSPHANFHDLSLLLVPGILVARCTACGEESGWRKYGLVALPLLGYAAVQTSLSVSSRLPLQPSVLFTLVGLIVLSWAAWHRECRLPPRVQR